MPFLCTIYLTAYVQYYPPRKRGKCTSPGHLAGRLYSQIISHAKIMAINTSYV